MKKSITYFLCLIPIITGILGLLDKISTEVWLGAMVIFVIVFSIVKSAKDEQI